MTKITKYASLLLLIGLLFTTNNLRSEDYPRKALYEGFTGANCAPCASFWPQADAFYWNYDTVFIPIKYHLNWPKPPEPMYDANADNNNARARTYYNISGVPTLLINGVQFGQDNQNIISDPIKTPQRSPYLITVSQTESGNNVNASVKLKTNVAINDKKLRVALVEWKVEFAGSNGEKEHYWVVRDMAPNAEGTPVILNANAEETYNFSIPKKDYDYNDLYLVAFLQDDSNKEVLQAGTNLKDRMTKTTITSVENIHHEKIERNITYKRKFKVKNESAIAATFKIDIDKASSVLANPNEFNISLDKPSVTLQPGQSEEFTATIKVDDQANYSRIVFRAVREPEALDQSAPFMYSTMTKDAKHAIYYFRPKVSEGHTAGEITKEFLKQYKDFKKDVVSVPQGDPDLYKYFPASDMKTAAFFSDFSSYQDFANSAVIKQQVTQMLNANKRVFMGVELGFSFAYESNPQLTVSPSWKTMLKTDLNIKHISRQAWFTADANGNPTARYSFKIAGISSDLVGQSIQTISLSTSNDRFSWFTEVIELDPAETITKPIYCYDKNPTKYAGVRKEFAAGKLVYLAFGINTVDDDNSRNIMLTSIYDWLMDDVSEEAKLTFENDVEILKFGEVKVGETKEGKVIFSNPGKKTLTITKIILDDTQNFSATLPSLPLSIETGQQFEIPITFHPTKKLEFAASLEFESNAHLSNNKYFTLTGEGVGVVAVPILTLGTKSVAFEPTLIRTTKKAEVSLKNTGSANLQITSITTKGDTKGVFEVAEMNLLPLTIIPDDADKLTISFMPIEAGDYSATIELTTNDPKNAKVEIPVKGKAFDDSRVNDPINDGNFSMRTLPNPVTNDGYVLLSVANTAVNLDVKIIDAAGRILENVFSNTSFLGTEKVKLDINNLSNGYYIISATADGKNYSMPLIIKK